MSEPLSFEDFQASLKAVGPPASLSLALQALWYDARGDWQRAHKLIDSESDADSMWTHAYLHRKEGDIGNAGYWYDRCRRPATSGALEAEWETIARTLLG